MQNYIQGDDILLYINTVNGYLPVMCLLDNPIDESTELIETTSRGSGGFRSYIGGIQDYSISFSAHVIIDPDLVSYEHIKQLKRNITVFDWVMRNDDYSFSETGKGFISSLNVQSASRELVTFNATITPSIGGISDVLAWSQNGFNIVSQDGDNLITI